MTGHLASRISALDWNTVQSSINERGYAILPGLLTQADCRALAGLYDTDSLFRSHIVMARYGFGRGEYRYFRTPLPDPVGQLRTALYPPLSTIANAWGRILGTRSDYPAGHDAFLRECHDHGQIRPTPLLLRYREGDFNCLHQDLYGDLVFPLQVACLLSEPGRDFTGGELVLTEQRPRQQSRVEVLPLRQGDAVVFAVHTRPSQGSRGPYRVQHRHGVSRLHSGERFVLGLIFHDAQ